MDKFIGKKLSILTKDDIVVGDLLSVDKENRILKVNASGEIVKINYSDIKSLKLYEEQEQIRKKHEIVLCEILEEYGPSIDSFTSNCALNIYEFINKKLFIYEKVGFYIGEDEIGGKILFNLAFNFECPVEIIFFERKNQLSFLNYLYFARNRNIKIQKNFSKKYDLLFISSEKNYVDLSEIGCENFIFLNKPCSDLSQKNNFILHYNPALMLDEKFKNIFIFSNLPEKIYRKYDLKRTGQNFLYLN